MKKLRNSAFVFLQCVAILSVVVSCDYENSVEPPYKNYFVKYYGGDGDQTAVDLIVNNDGSMIILGNWQDDVDSGNKIYLIKVDEHGNVVWEKKLGTFKEKAKDIEPTLDGNYVILSDYKFSETNIDIKLHRLRPDGSPIDSVVYGSIEIDEGSTVTPLDDGGFIVTGSTTLDTTVIIDPNTPNDLSDIFHYRCNSSLVFDSEFWKGQFGPGTLDFGTKVIQYSSNLFYVFGSSNQIHAGNPAGNQNLMYYSINAGGENGTPNYLGDFDSDTQSSFVMPVAEELGAGYLVVGTKFTPSGAISLHATRLRSPLLFNSVNDEQFDREVPVESRRITSLSATSIVHTNPGFLLIGNEARETGSNIWLTKIDINGNQLWSASYGSEAEEDLGAAVRELPNGKIIIAGSVRLINNQYKMVLMKVNSTGQLMD